MKAILVMMGTTGAGKTTHGRILAEKLGATYISSGDIARSLMDGRTDELFREGQLSPHETEIRDRIGKLMDEGQVCVLDGFPRVKDQVAWLNNRNAKLFVIRLDWSYPVLVCRWVNRIRDDYDTLKAYVLRDELYHKETERLLSPNVIIAHSSEQHIMDMSWLVRQSALKWLRTEVPDFRPKDSPRQIAIDKFIKEHHITLWHKERTVTYSMLHQDIEAKLWEIVNAE